MDDVRKWLNSSRNYVDGVKLLLAYSTDTKLKRLFTIEGETEFKRKKLLEILQQCLKPQPGAKVSVPAPAVTPKQMFENPSKWPAQMDEVLKALHEQWKGVYSERNHLCMKLPDWARTGNEAETGRIAHRILDLDDQCDEIYEQRDHYLQHGKLRDDHKPKKVVIDPVKMAVALKNAERYVREYKNKLTKKPDNVKWASKLKQFEEDVVYYKLQLKIDG